MSRARILLLLALAVIVILLALRTCSEGTTPGGTTPLVSGHDPGASSDPAERERAEARARSELASQYEAAMRAAVSTLHRYLAALPGEDRAAADAFWIAGKPTSNADEADLRALTAPPTAFRTRNRSPEPLDRAPVPEAVRIPVTLRLGLEGLPARRYEGWYDLQRAPGGNDWRITGASIDVVESPQ